MHARCNQTLSLYNITRLQPISTNNTHPPTSCLVKIYMHVRVHFVELGLTA